MVTIKIPTALRRFTDGAATIDVAASTVAEAVDRLIDEQPGLRAHLFSPVGELRPFVRLFLDTQDVTHGGKSVAVRDGQYLRIVPAIAGG